MKKWLYDKIVCWFIIRKSKRYIDGLTDCFVDSNKKLLLYMKCVYVDWLILETNYSFRSQYEAYHIINDFIKTN